MDITDAMIETAAKAMAEADGWDWGDNPDRVGRGMEWDYPPGETRRTEYGGQTKPKYRRRARAALTAVLGGG